MGLEQQSTLCLLRLRKGCSQWQEQLVFIFCTSILDWKRVWGGGRQGQTHPLEIPKSLRAEQFLVSTCLWAAACARTLAAVSETTNPGKNWLVWGTVSQPGPWVCLQSLQWGFCSWLLGGAEGFFFWGGGWYGRRTRRQLSAGWFQLSLPWFAYRIVTIPKLRPRYRFVYGF